MKTIELTVELTYDDEYTQSSAMKEWFKSVILQNDGVSNVNKLELHSNYFNEGFLVGEIRILSIRGDV